MKADDPVVVAAEACLNSVEVVTTYRRHPVIRALLKTYEQKERFRFDGEALREEIRTHTSGLTMKRFGLESAADIKTANDARFAIRAARDRLVVIDQKLRDIVLSVTHVCRAARVFLRNQPGLVGKTVKEADEIMSVIIGKPSDDLDEIKSLQSDIKAALAECDDNNRVIDSWFSLHKQYIFLTLPERRDHDEQTHRRLGQSSRRPPEPRRRPEEKEEEEDGGPAPGAYPTRGVPGSRRPP